MLVRRVEEGDPRAAEAVGEAGDALALAMVAAVNLLDPDAVVLGGLYALLAGRLAADVEAALRRSGGGLRGSVPTVRGSGLGMESAVRGAAGVVVRGVLDDPTVVG
ncbi:MAG: ROK family protein [Streptomycetaceae bacterium]|nr:ROK family protein [Streptomycetaceae bacterium]